MDCFLGKGAGKVHVQTVGLQNGSKEGLKFVYLAHASVTLVTLLVLLCPRVG